MEVRNEESHLLHNEEPYQPDERKIYLLGRFQV